SHPPAQVLSTRSMQNQCKMTPDLTRSWPSPYQEMYINSTKRQLSVGQDQKKEIKINNQMKQGFRVDRREKPRPPPPSTTTKQVPNNRSHPSTLSSQTSTKSEQKSTKNQQKNHSHPSAQGDHPLTKRPSAD
ncbi:hypothetical protein EV363DRAFT_1177807, partial [Boletus edulis]